MIVVGSMTRDYEAEDASRTRDRINLRLTDDERGALEALQTALGAPTLSAAVVAAVAATRALVAGERAAVALSAAREVAALPAPKRGWTKGKARG